jgi:hypothetical protein
MTTPALTLERLAELERQANASRTVYTCQTVLSLVAAARAHLELTSALEFMAHHEDLFDLWEDGSNGYKCAAPDERQDGAGLNTPTAALLDCARFRGWSLVAESPDLERETKL